MRSTMNITAKRLVLMHVFQTWSKTIASSETAICYNVCVGLFCPQVDYSILSHNTVLVSASRSNKIANILWFGWLTVSERFLLDLQLPGHYRLHDYTWKSCLPSHEMCNSPITLPEENGLINIYFTYVTCL